MSRPQTSIRVHPELTTALKESRHAFLSVALFSGMVNILILAGPLYMLQVYDRVLSSRSIPTLVGLSVCLVAAYAFQGGFEVVRARLAVRIASLLDLRLGPLVHDALIRLTNRNCGPTEASQPLRDLDQVRALLTGPAPIAILDLPWVPVFLALCFLIHPWLGTLALAGAIILVVLTLLTEQRSRAPTLATVHGAGARSAACEAARRNSETIAAMGMSRAVAERWQHVNDRYLAAVTRTSDLVGAYSSLSRATRILLQSAILGMGAYLVIRQELSAGAMFAASLMVGRALAPIDVVIANWRTLAGARQSLLRLCGTLRRPRTSVQRTDLPQPERMLEVEHLVVMAPGGKAAIVTDVHFGLAAGDVLAIVGPSGAGKTSLVRNLVGIWTAARGEIRLDGAALDQWDEETLGCHVGYVGQSIDFFDGTIAENIARMSSIPDDTAVLAAGRAAGVHDMILRLPGGYDCRIGEIGTVLSAGQRQRIALARALYREPFLVVLDEPNANLDAEGEVALQNALRTLKGRGAISIVISHRPSVLEQCDKVLVLGHGRQQSFGPRDAVLRKPAARLPRAAGHLALLQETVEPA